MYIGVFIYRSICQEMRHVTPASMSFLAPLLSLLIEKCAPNGART
jgi:hypothetical protein